MHACVCIHGVWLYVCNYTGLCLCIDAGYMSCEGCTLAPSLLNVQVLLMRRLACITHAHTAHSELSLFSLLISFVRSISISFFSLCSLFLLAFFFFLFPIFPLFLCLFLHFQFSSLRSYIVPSLLVCCFFVRFCLSVVSLCLYLSLTLSPSVLCLHGTIVRWALRP